MTPLLEILIYIFGWNPIDQSVLDKMVEVPKSIIIFSHSSYWDFWIFLLYRITYPSYFKHYKVLIKPEPFAYAGKLLRWIGAIPAGSLYKSKCGNTKVIIEELEKCDKWHLMLSPKGSILHVPWRSGYKVIAQHFGVPYRVVSLDYHYHRVVASNLIDSSNIEAANEQLLKHLSSTTPLNPENEIFETPKVPTYPINYQRILLAWGVGLAGLVYLLV